MVIDLREKHYSLLGKRGLFMVLFFMIRLDLTMTLLLLVSIALIFCVNFLLTRWRRNYCPGPVFWNSVIRSRNTAWIWKLWCSPAQCCRICPAVPS